MTHFLARRKTVPVFIINRYPRRRTTSGDVLAMIVSGAFLLFALAWAITGAMQ